MVNFNYCNTILDAKKLFVAAMDKRHPLVIDGNVVPISRIYATLFRDVFENKFYHFLGELVAHGYAPAEAIRWSLSNLDERIGYN